VRLQITLYHDLFVLILVRSVLLLHYLIIWAKEKVLIVRQILHTGLLHMVQKLADIILMVHAMIVLVRSPPEQ
jgi:hypothetical protein